MPSSPPPKASSSVPLAREGRQVPASGSMLKSDEPDFLSSSSSSSSSSSIPASTGTRFEDEDDDEDEHDPVGHEQF